MIEGVTPGRVGRTQQAQMMTQAESWTQDTSGDTFGKNKTSEVQVNETANNDIRSFEQTELCATG